MSLNFDNPMVQNNMYSATFGIEKESLRVTENGCLSHTKHPFHGKSNIDRDFCENQVEIITDVWDNTDAVFTQLSHLHNSVLAELSKLEPIKALLFSNSVLLDEDEKNLCCRDMFWENSTHGINPHNIGMYNCEFADIDDILSYIETTSIYCVERGDKYINFAPTRLDDYFSSDKITGEYFDNGEYREIEFAPQLSDLEYLRTFKFEDLTFRGTIEFRSVCCQPIKDSFCVAAFHIGLMDKVEELAEILDNDHTLYHHGYTAGELRKILVRSELPKFVDEDRLYDLARQIVDLAHKGLSERGMGEEKLLSPLYERIESRTNPAKRMLTLKNSKTDLKEIIQEYGFLPYRKLL